MDIIRVDSPHGAGLMAAAIIATRAIEGRIRVALPGGRSVVPTYEALSGYPASVLENLSIRIADERIFGEKNEDVIRARLIEPAAELGAAIDLDSPVRDGSRDEIVGSYERTIGDEPFDVVLIGVGEDGHVLGLYPGSDQLDSDRSVEAFDDSPKPPPERMTTTFRCYDPQRTIAILLFIGDGKRDALERFVQEPDYHELPAAYFHRFARAYALTDQHL